MSKPIARSHEINFMPDQDWTIERYLDKNKKKKGRKEGKERKEYRIRDNLIFLFDVSISIGKAICSLIREEVPWEIKELTWDVSVLFHAA